ncbi:hypothetical protein HYO57_22625 [Vibrio parahaemolyticus]|nr:hypothetical protein [Vibrio parahaemolyticus]
MNDKDQKSTEYVIMNPLLGKPMEKTPCGKSLKNVTFKTKQELQEFVDKHWSNPVYMTDGKDLELPES